ncbi:hypothetical protein [Adhaeribacter rhizoryzae]|nr:hypothetical protein [Adhaeribacter rhizoryzae]
MIRELMFDDGILPITLGVFDDWDNGKPSFMKLMEVRFQEVGN